MHHNAFDDARGPAVVNENNVFAKFLRDSGLYEEIEISKDNIEDLIELVRGNGKINSFCPSCGEMRVFSVAPIFYLNENEMRGDCYKQYLADDFESLQKTGFTRTIIHKDGSREEKWGWKNWQCENAARLMVFTFTCAMHDSHKIDYIVLTGEYSMKKIGQFPSVADLSFPELKEYKKVLTKEDMSELRRAIGLYAQGIGVGSYVYLRRIFERIIDTAKNTAIAEGKAAEDEYAKARVDERIKLLKDYLPEMLVENPVFYSIVSKGIHELDEDTCIKFFPVLQEAIFMILRQWEQIRQENEAKARLAASISKIASSIK